MSFYDLTKDGVLRPEDLFKYRLKRDSTIPSRGGQKEFEPDGSWLQNKRLEAFLQERTSLLSEPRVEKLKNVVKGLWNGAKHLVDLEKPRKFWMHMGFTDERRNWLYPEEALFLMETNTLEVYHHERPMSIQEAYIKLLGHGVCLEEYQVFSHLRRLGYIVLRHEEERIFTDYERRINIHEYVDKKSRKGKLEKEKGISKKKTSKSSSDKDKLTDKLTCDASPDQVSDVSNQNGEHLNGSVDTSNNSTDLCAKRILENKTLSDGSPVKKCKLTDDTDETSSDVSNSGCASESSFYNVSSWTSCFKKQSPDSTAGVNGESHQRSPHLSQAVMDPECRSLFPDIAQCSSLSQLRLPPLHLLPSNLGICQTDVDCSTVQLKTSPSNTFGEMSAKPEVNKEKEFSCLSGLGREPKVSASSWCEYKHQKSQRLAQTSSTTLVDYLWKGDDVTPLINPAHVTTYKDVMDRLCIIKSAEPEDLKPEVPDNVSLPKVCFDVHLPDHSFKKTMPGIPDHRVCVSRSDGIPPDLNAIQHLTTRLTDGVPLHWAVVDSGEIAFYVFDNSRPVEVLVV